MCNARVWRARLGCHTGADPCAADMSANRVWPATNTTIVAAAAARIAIGKHAMAVTAVRAATADGRATRTITRGRTIAASGSTTRRCITAANPHQRARPSS